MFLWPLSVILNVHFLKKKERVKNLLSVHCNTQRLSPHMIFYIHIMEKETMEKTEWGKWLVFHLTPLSVLKRRQPSPHLFSYSILSVTFNALTRGEAARIKVALLSYSIRAGYLFSLLVIFPLITDCFPAGRMKDAD